MWASYSSKLSIASCLRNPSLGITSRLALTALTAFMKFIPRFIIRKARTTVADRLMPWLQWTNIFPEERKKSYSSHGMKLDHSSITVYWVIFIQCYFRPSSLTVSRCPVMNLHRQIKGIWYETLSWKKRSPGKIHEKDNRLSKNQCSILHHPHM